jgi:hypothetical protein
MTAPGSGKLETAEMGPETWELSDKILRRVEVVVRAEMSRWRTMQAADMEDVVSDAVASILAKTEDQREQVVDAEAYAAGIARRMCSAWLRRRHPEYHRLRSRMRYQLRRDPGLHSGRTCSSNGSAAGGKMKGKTHCLPVFWKG